ncbi:diguanylate cyclase [Nitratireductor aquimarinus]|uniref:diguanylate cyclase n=1 Tax=Nitratireductor aquimarinus TaxID=889300 RepID=A0ABU4AP17_9HYPH|nr:MULTISPECIES: diguanylate cyclase [Alphaproteobacteria]MBY6020210.1 diguanylate cyclase [Nitratireductor sp. DP7N14-4]MBN7755428.1 diguanylate cyclase [Nitratireductor aquimarinus]MBN7763994.1 diguanylate cyclase [Nitratireductor aquibiodomus]MBN7775905.1 diguanylate cyclase [Nitratireductor pacificus]MBN7780568.1 diguanylate cyclase [Nitratireductor pacificus]
MSTALLISGVLQNLGIAAIAALFYDIVLRRSPNDATRHALIAVVFAAGAVGSMSLPVQVAPGLIFDLRNSFVILAMSFGGWLTLGLTTVAAIAFRLWIGGAGAIAGAIGILVCAGAGLAFAMLFKRERISLPTFGLLGAVSGLSLLSMFVLPYETAIALLSNVGPVMLLMNVLGTMLVGGIVERQRQQYERENTLTREASTDALTRLANRRVFDMRGPNIMDSAMRRGEACTLMLIDIDHFKQINDVHGHDVGDKVLKHLAALVRANVRQSDLVARFGGEEIALVLPMHDANRGFNLGERLRKAVEATPYLHEDGAEIRISVSIGVYANNGEDAAEPFSAAFKRADMALYRAKSAGRNRVEIAIAA